MMKITLGRKLFLFTSGTVVIILLATFHLLERSQSWQWEEHLREQSLSFARFATPELLKIFRGLFPSREDVTLPDVYELLASNRDLVGFALISPSGRVLFESPEVRPAADDRTKIPAIEGIARLSEKEATAVTLELPGSGRILDVIAPAFGPTGEHVLSVRYLFSYRSMDERLQAMRRQFLRIALMSIAFSLCFVALVARRITRPIQELTLGARAVARGDLGTRIETHGSDEIGILADAFNEMATSLSHSQRELTTKNTALLEANNELLRVQEQMMRAERLAAIGQLAAGISHEIDNPVGIILGYAELLREDLPAGDPRIEDVQAIIDECKRCRRITGGLLGLARSVPSLRESVSLVTLTEETLASLRPHKLFRDLEIIFSAPENSLRIAADGDQLRQVLVNLFLNAAQAMKGRGRLSVKADLMEDTAVLTVLDTGPGIPGELRETIFDPFFSTKAKGEGTGLGLSVCRKLVEDHGGRITAGEAPGGGAAFRVEIPIVPPEKCFDKAPANSLG